MEEKATWWPCKHVSTCLKPKNNFEYHDKKISWKRKLVLRPRAKRTTRSKMGQYFNEVEFHSCTMVISGYQKYCSTHQHHIGHMNQKILRPTTFHCPQTFFYVLKIFGDSSFRVFCEKQKKTHPYCTVKFPFTEMVAENMYR